jgi:hypothetical protein
MKHGERMTHRPFDTTRVAPTFLGASASVISIDSVGSVKSRSVHVHRPAGWGWERTAYRTRGRVRFVSWRRPAILTQR